MPTNAFIFPLSDADKAKVLEMLQRLEEEEVSPPGEADASAARSLEKRLSGIDLGM